MKKGSLADVPSGRRVRHGHAGAHRRRRRAEGALPLHRRVWRYFAGRFVHRHVHARPAAAASRPAALDRERIQVRRQRREPDLERRLRRGGVRRPAQNSRRRDGVDARKRGACFHSLNRIRPALRQDPRVQCRRVWKRNVGQRQDGAVVGRRRANPRRVSQQAAQVRRRFAHIPHRRAHPVRRGRRHILGGGSQRRRRIVFVRGLGAGRRSARSAERADYARG